MKKIIIKENDSGQRIDKFLAKEFFSYSRGEIIRQIKSGNVLVNKKIVKPSYVLKEKDIIETVISEQGSENGIVANSYIKLNIIFQDKNIIVVDKPAGLQVHPDHNKKDNTLVNVLIAKFPEIKEVGDDPIRPGIVHRLDKDTSGIMIVARNQNTFEELKKKFKNREVEKQYRAIVYGKPEKEGVIDKPLARASNYKKQVVAGRKTKTKIRAAVTKYKALKSWGGYSFLEVMPKTGRMHQIRVHMASIGHPIVGDNIYKSKRIKKVAAVRQMLHARSIKFELFGKNYRFSAGEPEDFRRFLTKGE